MDGGQLRLEGLDLVVLWPEKFTDTLTLVAVHDGDFAAQDCTFSLSGKQVGPVAIASFAGTNGETHHCRFTNCLLRGDSLQALELDDPGAEVLFENCLAAGGEYPLLLVRGGGERPATLCVVLSTFVAANALLKVYAAQPGDKSPSVNWLSWDSILSRTNEKTGGEMIVLPNNADDDAKSTGRPYNTLYAGWQKLLSGNGTGAHTTRLASVAAGDE